MSSDTTQIRKYRYNHAGYPNNLALGTRTLPLTPAPHHVIISVKAVALNPVDIQLMNLPLHNLPTRGHEKTPGFDFSGVILAVSPESGYSINDEVMGVTSVSGPGFLQEIVHCDVRTVTMIKKPSTFSWVQAAALPLVWLTARTTIEKVMPRLQSSPHQLVVLGGSSSTGIYTIKQAVKRGWKVLSTCSGRNVDFVKSLGAEQVVDYTSSPDAVVKAVKAFQPQSIIDNVGGTECIGLADQYVTIVGDKTSRLSLGGSALYFTNPQMVLRWLLGYLGLGKSYDCVLLEGRQDWLEEVKNLQPDEVIIDSVFKFDEAKKAYERLNTGRARGKVVVTVGEEN